LFSSPLRAPKSSLMFPRGESIDHARYDSTPGRGLTAGIS
jgi:hypothetical protein